MVLFPLLILLIIPIKSLNAKNRHIIKKEDIIVFFEEPLRIAAKEASDFYPALKAELEKKLKWRVNFRPTILLIKDNKTFQTMAGSDLVVAFAVPGRNLIVIDYSKMKTHPFSIEITLQHELCHLLLHSQIEGKNLPRWLDEGIAQWISGGIPEIIMDQKRSVLNEAILSGKYLRIRALTDRFPVEKKSLMLAYEESKSLVEYIISQFGIEGILMILNNLKDGDEVDKAIFKSLSIDLDELEGQWHHHLKKRITWLTYLINHLYEILFSLAALVMIFGFIRRLIQKRAYMDEED